MSKRKWYSLIDKVNRQDNLESAWKAVKANRGSAGVDGVTIKDFGKNLDQNLLELQDELKEKQYKPQPVRRVEIKKDHGGIRPLGIPAIRDRVVQESARSVLEPIFEAKFLDCSYGFRPGRSAHMAIEQIRTYLEAGYVWVEERLGLTLHPDKTRIADARQGFDFLGYHFKVVHFRGRTKEEDTFKCFLKPSEKALKKFEAKIREITRRNQTTNMPTLMKKLNPYIRGWANYYGLGNVKTLFETMDSWIRRRVRMVQMRSWRNYRRIWSILVRKGWKKDKLLGLSMTRWRNSACQMVHAALDLKWFETIGFVSLMSVYENLRATKA